MHDKADGETEITNHSRVCNAFNPGLMEQPPLLPLPLGLPGDLYTVVYLEPPNTPWFTWNPPLPPGLPGALHYPLVYLEPSTTPWFTWSPPILPCLPGAPTIPWSTWGPHYSLVYLEPPNTPRSTWSSHYPMVYLEPPLFPGLPGASLPPGLPEAPYTIVHLESSNTPWSTRSPRYPMVYMEPQYSLVYLIYEPHVYPPVLPGYLKKRLNRTSSPLESAPSYVNILYTINNVDLILKFQ